MAKARLFVPLATLQDLVGAHDKASIFLLRCTRPEHTEDVIQELRHVLPGYTIRPLKDFLSLMTATNIPGLKTFIHAMIGLAVAIGLLVIFLTMYTTVIERTRDIGVLKSSAQTALLSSVPSSANPPPSASSASPQELVSATWCAPRFSPDSPPSLS